MTAHKLNTDVPNSQEDLGRTRPLVSSKDEFPLDEWWNRGRRKWPWYPSSHIVPFGMLFSIQLGSRQTSFYHMSTITISLDFFKLFILVLIACVCVWLCGDMCTHECGCSQYPEEDIISPGSRIESGCKVHDINVGKWISGLWRSSKCHLSGQFS